SAPCHCPNRCSPPPWLVKLRGYRLVRKLDSHGRLPSIRGALSPTTHAPLSSVAGSNFSFLSAVISRQSRIPREITPTHGVFRLSLNICIKTRGPCRAGSAPSEE